MASYSIKEAIDHPHRYASSPPGHGSTGCPLIGVGVIALYSPQAGRTITATNSVKSKRENTRQPSSSRINTTLSIQV